MNKAELIDAIAADCNVTKAGVKLVLDSTLRVIKTAVASGDEVAIADFGLFRAKKVNGCLRHDLYRGDKLFVPATRRPRFKAFTDFKRLVASKEP